MLRLESASPLAENQLEVLLGLSSDLLFITGLDGYFKAVNPSFARHLGYSKEQLLSHSFKEFIHPDDRAQAIEKLEKLIQTKGHTQFEIRYCCQNGTYLYICWTVQVSEQFIQGAGKLNAAELTSTQQKLAALRSDYIHDIQQKDNYAEKQSNMISELCHELRNPLSGIYASINIAQEAIEKLQFKEAPLIEKSISEVNEALADIRLCAEQQKYLLDDFLTFSKLEAKQLKLAKSPFDARKAIQDAVSILQYQAKEKQLSLQVELPEEPIILKGDKYRLRQIVINLLSNAIKFTQQGGVTITLNAVQQTQKHTYLQITVQDTGIGLSSEEQLKLFKHFSQSNQFITSQYGGTGLGLFITKQLVELMKGNIQVESEKNTGTTFTGLVRCRNLTKKEILEFNQAQVSLTGDKPPPVSFIRRTVLIVDDNIINQKVLLNIIEKAGHIGRVANNGLEAIHTLFNRKSLNYQAFDILFMDINMPVLDGLAATRAIRQKEKENGLSPLSIVGLSGNSQATDKEAALDAGMNDYISKPFQKEQVYQMIQQYCAGNIYPALAVSDNISDKLTLA